MNTISRNELCPCGSGKKYKHCCGAPINQSKEELKNHLIESIEFLIKSCMLYDDGDKPEAKRIAVELRKMLHDTGMSESIFTTLQLKNIYFIDTSIAIINGNNSASVSLSNISQHISFRLNTNLADSTDSVDFKNIFLLNESTAEFKPRLNGKEVNKKILFEEWWNNIIICDSENNEFSRKDIVLALANQDGGAHVDREIENTYYKLTRENTFGSFIYNKFGGNIPIKNIHLSTVRQIAHEVIKTLEYELPDLHDNTYILKYNDLIK
jgi:hypothetical protein